LLYSIFTLINAWYNPLVLLEKYEIYRIQLKDIRNKQEELQSLYSKQEKITKSLKDAHKKNKPTDSLTEELANLEITVGHTEADLFFIKRKSLHTGLMLQFEGMRELASKVMIRSIRLLKKKCSNKSFKDVHHC
jgi:hypothetical protein